MTLAPGGWRRQYDEPIDDVRGKAAQIHNIEPSLTIQSFRDDTDINVLLDRMGVKDGSFLPAAPDPRYYGDFTASLDMKTALDNLRVAQERFMQLPAEVRGYFLNDPVRLLQFVEDPKNREEAVKMGLLAPPPAPPPPDTVVSAST